MPLRSPRMTSQRIYPAIPTRRARRKGPYRMNCHMSPPIGRSPRTGSTTAQRIFISVAAPWVWCPGLGSSKPISKARTSRCCRWVITAWATNSLACRSWRIANSLAPLTYRSCSLSSRASVRARPLKRNLCNNPRCCPDASAGPALALTKRGEEIPSKNWCHHCFGACS